MLPRDKTLEANLLAVMHLILGRLIHLIIKRQVPQTIWIELHEYEAPKATISVFSHEQSFKCFMCLYYIQRLLFDQERLQLTNRQLEEEVGRLKAFYESNFVENGQLETYKQELEAKSRFELNRKLEEVNAHLEEQAAAREKLDKLREANELKTRKELEMTITDLKADVAKMRAGFHESQTRKETLDAEAKRYKDLYESEMKSKDRLASRLYKANEKMAESQALLNLERSRRNFDGLKRDTSPHQFTSGGILNGSPRTSPDRMYSKGDGQLMKAVEDELNKSIKRHLESAPLTSDLDLKPSLLSDGDSGSYGPLTASSKQYMSVLRKNYFV